MEPGELVMVLANWKAELYEQKSTDREAAWARLRNGDFWRLVNYVLDTITMPSCVVYVGVHAWNPETPMCWAAVRNGELLFTYYRKGLDKDAELLGMLQDVFLTILPVVAIKFRDFNPFRELEYHASLSRQSAPRSAV
jgi:hypothetical protein